MFNPKFVDVTAKMNYYRALAQYFYVVGMARAEGFDAEEYMTKEMVDAHARWCFENEPWPEVPCADMEEPEDGYCDGNCRLECCLNCNIQNCPEDRK